MDTNKTVTDNTGQQLLAETKIDSYLMIAIYTIQDFLKWWYVKMSMWHLRKLKRFSIVLNDQLSILLLLKNFFLPWRRDASLIGYFFGILIKLLFLPITISIYIISMLIYIIIILGWLILPVGTLTFILISIIK
ncbi:MAG: hypothetical protein PHE21_01395 [Candidatus Dojkabacteria bacterium]|nr:hypothetical protein [Candidatus Dojkabacteria bacterium]